MHSLLSLLLLLLPLYATALPPRHHIYSPRYSPYATQPQPPQSLEVSRPLPFDSISPSCTLPILSHSFGNTAAVATYTPPSPCRSWSRAVLQLSGSCNGSQSDRIAGVWLDGVELLRTSTPKPGSDGIFWNVRKDVSRYSSLLRKSNVDLTVMLENAVDDVNRGVYQLNLTFLYYEGAGAGSVTAHFPLSLSSEEELAKNSEASILMDSFNLNEDPADLIIPISSTGDEGSWFKIQSELDSARKGIQIPMNAYRAVIELYVSSHKNDELWYSNPPNSYIEKNQLPTKKGNGAYREIEVKIDDTSVGSVIPFPVIYPGVINPLYWKPLVPIGAFNMPSYQLELTPFLGMLLDGRNHTFEFGVTGAISYWLVDANLHLWLDGAADKVVAGIIRIKNPGSRVQRSEEFRLLDGTATVQGNRLGEFKGWVSYSAGNFTTWVEHDFKVDNNIEYKNGGQEKVVKQTVEMRTKVKVEAYKKTISDWKVKSKYYLQITDTKEPGLAKDTNLTYGKMENRFKEERTKGQAINEVDNIQKCNGWLLSRDGDIISGTASTFHEYEEKDRGSCYMRRAFAEGGVLKNDTDVPCSNALAW